MASVTAVQIGSYFVGQYYQVLQQQPELGYQFYTDSSTMILVDGDSSESASAILKIHSLLLSLNFTAIEIKTINSMESLNGGVLVVVKGSVKTKDFNGRRNFVQNFFLAPQKKGYFVLNDVFQFIEDGMIYQHPAPVLSENKFDTQLDTHAPLEQPVSDYDLEEESREYVNSAHIEDDTVDKYSLPEQQHHHDFGAEIVVEETPIDELSSLLESVVNHVRESPAPAVEEPVGPPPKKTWASILQVPIVPAASPVGTQPSIRSAPTSSEWDYIPQFAPNQSFVHESRVETAEEGFPPDEGESKSVYVRNLPSTVATAEIEQEFKTFGKIKPNGVFIRLRKEINACYAFVEFEDILGVQNAIKASPIEIGGRKIYIEERRANSNGASRGGRREGAEAVTKQMLRGGVLVVGLQAKEATKMVAITTAREATVSISELPDKTKLLVKKTILQIPVLFISI